jgi:parvulin-like peptidyl-prolyl isomerase
MTIRSRPILDRRHRPRWQDEMRTQQLIVIGFALAIALALGIFGAAAWNGYWETHLRPVASVEGTTFTQSDADTRATILGAEIAAEATELSLQIVENGPRNQLLEQQITSLSEAAQQVDSTAVASLVDGAVLGSREDEYGLEVTDEEVDAAVAERTVRPERIQARLILVDPLPDDAEPDAEPTDEQLAAAREEVQAAIDRVDGGEAFEDVATEVSDDFTAATGGELGWFRADDLVYDDYFEALADAEVGEVVGPVETENGYAALLLVDRREASTEGGLNALLEQQGVSDEEYRQFVADAILIDEYETYFGEEVLTTPAPQQRVGVIAIQPISGGGDPVPQERARHILIQPDPELEDQAEATPQQWAMAMAEAGSVHELVSAENADWFSIAEEFSDDTGSGQRGGDLGWYDPESPSFVEEFATALADLEVGEISEPVETEFGWHVIQKTGERESPDQLAAEVVDRLRDDPDRFAEVAALVSEDYPTAAEGGELGWVARWQLERMLEDAVFGLSEVGDISDPVTDSAGTIRIYQLLESSDSEEIEEDRLEQIRTNGVTRWLDEEVRAPVETWIDQEFRSSTAA